MQKQVLILIFMLISFSTFLFGDVVIFFYNPDAAATDVELLIKKSVDYFQKVSSGLKLQPVSSPEIFTDVVVTKKQAKAFIVSSWLLKNLGSDVKEILKPVSTDGKSTFKKIVLVKEGGPKTITELKGQNFASTSLGADSLKFLNEYLFSIGGFDGNSAKIIWVKKDLDALLAAKFGQVKAAIIAEKNIEKIQKINPVAVSGLVKILTSKEIDEASLCVMSDLAASEVEAIKKSFLDMDKIDAGKEFLNILGYSKWIAK